MDKAPLRFWGGCIYRDEDYSMTPDLDRIIAGLSVYERNAMSGRIVHITKRDGLVAKGLIVQQGCPNWTTTGLAVRQRLQEMNDG